MIKTREMQRIPEGTSAFQADLHHQGMMVGKNVVIMYTHSTTDKQDYIIVVNLETGERLRVAFNPEGYELTFLEKLALINKVVG